MLINWNDCIGRYPELASLRDATRADSFYTAYAVAELNARLAPRFTVPVSDNNLTAKDLAIDLTFAKLYRYKDQEKAAAVTSYVGQFIDDLLSGNASMITTSGQTIDSVGGTVFSTTQNYHPVFGLSPPRLWEVDSSQVIAEETARGYPAGNR
jgi:hypothetical protein